MTYDRRFVFAAACLGMLVFGIVLTLLGAILPALIERFGVDKSTAGSLLSLMSIGILTGSVVFGPIADRFGYKMLLIVCTALIFLGVEGIAFAPDLGWLRAAVFVVGFGGGIINGGTNALVADISEEGRGAGLSILGVFFGIGAFGLPLALGFLISHFSFSELMGALGILVLVPLLFVALIGFPQPKQAQGFPLREGLALLKEPVLLLFGLMLFLQSGIEITSGGWTTTYFGEVLALPPDRALFFLSLFWLGLIIARLLLGILLRRAAPARMLLICLGTAFVGVVLLLASTGLLLAAPGIFLLGAGLAGGFPIVLGFVGDRYPHLSGTAFGIVLVMALTGGSVLPYVAGVLGEAFGLRTSFLILPVALVLMAMLLGLAVRRMAGAPPHSHSSSTTSHARKDLA